jgi:hypothetical protein
MLPFVQAADGLELGGVVTRDPRRRAELGQDHPGVPVYDSQRALLDAGVDIHQTLPPGRGPRADQARVWARDHTGATGGSRRDGG